MVSITVSIHTFQWQNYVDIHALMSVIHMLRACNAWSREILYNCSRSKQWIGGPTQVRASWTAGHTSADRPSPLATTCCPGMKEIQQHAAVLGRVTTHKPWNSC